MTKLYKLTDEQGRTRAGEDNELKWAVGVEHKTAGTGSRLCTADVIHAYEHPLIAVLMNSLHADFNPTTMRLFVAEGEIIAREGQLKCGVHALKIVEELPVPVLTVEQRVKFAILCAKTVCKDAAWNVWADRWLSGEDRSKAAAKAVAEAAARAAEEAAKAAARAAEEAAKAAAWAATWAAAWAATWAAKAANLLDLIQIVEQL